MSTATTTTGHTPGWVTAEQMRAMGFTHDGPEVEYGMRWGEHRDIRVSFAPYPQADRGYLYAHNPGTDRYLLLAADTTRGQVDTAWGELTACTASPDGYLAFAALDHPHRPLSFEHASHLLSHCVAREMDAYQAFDAVGCDGRTRFDAAYAIVVQRSARAAAEQQLVDAAHAANPDSEPVVVRYRILGRRGWSGRVAGPDLDSAAAATKTVHELARRHQLTLQATSVTQGHTNIAAARVPELGFAATRAPLAVDAPSPAL